MILQSVTFCRDLVGVMPSVYDCPVCFCEYSTEGQQTPYVLPCGHSVCLECSFRLLGSPPKDAKCPFCRRSLPTHKNGLSVNYALLSVLDQHFDSRKSMSICSSSKTEVVENSQKDETGYSHNSGMYSSGRNNLSASSRSSNLKMFLDRNSFAEESQSTSCIFVENISAFQTDATFARSPRRLGNEQHGRLVSHKTVVDRYSKFSGTKSASNLNTHRSSLARATPTAPPVPPKVPLNYSFIEAGESIPPHRLPHSNTTILPASQHHKCQSSSSDLYSHVV